MIFKMTWFEFVESWIIYCSSLDATTIPLRGMTMAVVVPLAPEHLQFGAFAVTLIPESCPHPFVILYESSITISACVILDSK